MVDTCVSTIFLSEVKLVVFVIESCANIEFVGEKRQCILKNWAGIIVFQIRIITVDIDYSTKHCFVIADHTILLLENRPRKPGAVNCVKD